MPRALPFPSAPSLQPGAWSLPPDPSDLALLDWADPDPDERVVLIGPNCLELMCALIRRGSLDVAIMRLADRPEAGCADLALIANVGTTEALECAISHARRALSPFGSLVIGLSPDHAESHAARGVPLLLARGFARVRRRGPLLRAELPLKGGLRCA